MECLTKCFQFIRHITKSNGRLEILKVRANYFFMGPFKGNVFTLVESTWNNFNDASTNKGSLTYCSV